jgi:hypothetical protein
MCAQSPPAFAAEQINPYPRQVCRVEKVAQWTFEDGAAGWKALHNCSLAVKDGRMVVTCTDDDPYLHIPARAPGGRLLLRLRAKCGGTGGGQVFWVTAESPRWEERKSQRFGLEHDGKWRDYEVPLSVEGTLTGLRLDPGAGAGRVEIERLELRRSELHPLEIVRLGAEGRRVRVWVRNHSDRAVRFTVAGNDYQAAAGRTVEAELTDESGAPFAAVAATVRSEGLPELSRSAFLYDPSAAGDWIVRKSGQVTMRVAADASGAVLQRGDRTVAVLAPIVSCGAVPPGLKLTEMDSGVRIAAKGLQTTLELRRDELAVSIRSDRPCEGPRLRAIGPLEQGLFAGLEYLGKGERSSSTLDIETPEHLRCAPDPLKVTMPLMAAVTDRGTAAMTWKDMSLQPVFASPDFFDGSDDHLMALRGKRIEATVRITGPEPIEEAILWALKKHGLPPLPKAPRTPQEQWDLCLRSIRGPISGEGGWGHCAEPRWGRAPFADIASTIWRLAHQAPELPRLQPGGAHVRNDAIYFVTGRAKQWLDMRRGQVKGTIARQRPDGSFGYSGPYRRGHFEDTASGFCARPALDLLSFAWLTGDREALAAGLKTLEYVRRFRTPRGAQTWELPLHTPDILASGYLVGAYVRGYQATGKEEYFAEARRWALSGVPFVYLWGRYPVMAYATVPVYGATNWQAPNWMGLPVQWCGGVYAYWLTKLAPYDRTLDWHHLAEGILIAGEQMQYPAGEKLGCLPDVFFLPNQRRAGPSINPCGMVSLRLAVAGEADSLAAAAGGRRRVCAPYPVAIRDGKAHIRAKAGATYEVLIDGERIVAVQSKGDDVIPLGAAPGQAER